MAIHALQFAATVTDLDPKLGDISGDLSAFLPKHCDPELISFFLSLGWPWAALVQLDLGLPSCGKVSGE